MTLTLKSSLTSTVSREIRAASNLNHTLGTSLTTGNNEDIEVVDSFLGNTLQSDAIIKGAIAKTSAYGINMLNVADAYISLTRELVRDSMNLISTAEGKSPNKVAVLQKNLNDKQEQISLLINAAKYDGKHLLNGSVRDLAMQVGRNVDDKIEMNIINIGDGKLLRSSLASAYNEYIHTNFAALQADIVYYQNQSEIDTDYRENKNLLQLAERDAPYPGSGTGGIPGWPNVANVWHAILNGPNGAQYAATLNRAAPNTLAALKNVGVANPNRDFSNASVNEIRQALVATAVYAGVNPRYYADEIKRVIYDNQPLSLSSSQDIAVAYDIFKGALHTLRSAQAQISNTKKNIISAIDALKATTVVTEKAADSYLKTNYVETSNKYAQNLRTIVGSISALQASNKIIDAAQKLVDSLAD